MTENSTVKYAHFFLGRRLVSAGFIAFAVTGLMALTSAPETFVTGKSVPPLSADGYHYLYLAEELADGLSFAPFLSWLTWWSAHFFSCTVVDVVPYVSLVLYFLSIVALFWCYTLVLPLTAAGIGAAVSGLYPYYYFRATPDWFDTDSIIIFCLSVLCGSVIAFCKSRRHRWKYGVLFSIAAGLLWWTWGLSAFVAFFFVLCAVVPFLTLRRLMAILVLSGIACALIIVFDSSVVDWGLAHAHLLFSGEIERLAGIAELQPAYVLDLLNTLPIGIVFGSIVTVGILYSFVAGRKEFCALLFPWLLLGALCLVSARFALFMAPIIGLGVASFYMMIRQKGLLVSHYVHIMVVSFLVLPFGVHVCTAPRSKTLFSQNQVQLVSALTDYGQTNSDAMLFSWWDTGYFARFVTGVPVFADGGRQNEIRIRALQHILSLQDVQAAKNMMRFLAVNGFNAFFAIPAPLSTLGNSNSQIAFEERMLWITRLLSAENKAKELMKQKGMSIRHWMPILFPSNSKTIFVYLDEGLFDRTWWYLPSGKIMSFPVATLKLHGMPLKGKESVELNGIETPVSMSITRYRSVTLVNVLNSQDGVAVVETGNEQILLPSLMVQSLAGRLLLFGKAEGFSPVAYRAGVGGIWQIQ